MAAQSAAPPRRRSTGRLVGGIVLLVLGSLSLLGTLGNLSDSLDSNGGAYVAGQLLVPALMLGGGLFLLLRSSR